MRAYEAYQGHQLLAARYATDCFRVLVVAPTLSRVRRIAEEVVKVTRDVSPRCLLMAEERVHPTTIRRGWLGVDAVQWEPKQVVPVGGDLDWMKGGWFTYPAPMLGRHLVLIGASNTGKTETSKRLAYGAAKVYGWRVFYLDCKGDSGTATEFLAATRSRSSLMRRTTAGGATAWRSLIGCLRF